MSFVWLVCSHVLLSVSYAVSTPNILFVVIDDLGYRDLGYHGAEFETTHLDSLARNGIDLTNYYVQLVCTPTRSSLMTGLYPWRTGLQQATTLMPGSLGHIPFDTPTIAEKLKSVGYNTQMIGKWHLGFAARNMTPTGRGFNDYFGYYNGAEDYYTHEINNGYDLVYNNVPQKQDMGSYTADKFFDYYVNYLKDNYNKSSANYNKQPLYMYLALQTIHAPIQKPPLVNIYDQDMTAIYDKQCGHINNTMRMWYCQKLQYVDVYIGHIIQLYKQLQLWNDTLFIVTTDNGGMTNHNQTDNNPLGNFTVTCGCNYPLRAGKATLFEGGVKGLAFVSGPLVPENKRGTKNNDLFGAIDWFPSIMSYVGHENDIPSGLDGRNIMDSLFGNKPFNRSRIHLFTNFAVDTDIIVGSFIDAAVIDNGWKYMYGDNLYYCYYVVYPEEETICLNNTGFISNEYLFNLNEDPYEKNNLIDQYPERKDYLISLIIEDAINNGYVFNDIDAIWNASCPQYHNGSWLSWLDEPHTNKIVTGC